MTLYANRSKFRRPRLQKKDLVYLLRRNIKTTRLNDKLDLKKIGPFKVKRNIRDISFEFKLPLTIRIYPIFHFLLLESAHLNTLKDLASKLNPEI